MRKHVIFALMLGASSPVTAGLLEWLNPPPDKPFADSTVPPAPDYADEASWAALPWRDDAGDQLPPQSHYEDGQSSAEVDVFFLHPTTAVFGGSGWIGAHDSLITRIVTDRGTLPQQVTVFNGSARVFAPRFRQMRMATFGKGTAADRAGAMGIGVTDISAAFDHYMTHWNDGRGVIIAAYSQGAMFAEQLVAARAVNPDFRQQLVAAYLIGSRIKPAAFGEAIPLCGAAEQTGCFLAWNSIARDGEAGRYGANGPLACVNPLNWTNDGTPADASENLGSLPMVGLTGIKPLTDANVGGRCGDDGILWIDRPQAEGFTAQVSSTGSYHPYEFNLYWVNIRANVKQRADSYIQQQN